MDTRPAGHHLDRLQPAGRPRDARRPSLVLSPAVFNDRTSLVIGLPMTTAAYNADNPVASRARPRGARPGRPATCCAISRSPSLALARRPTAPAWTPVRRPAGPGLRMSEPDRPSGVMIHCVVSAVRKGYRLRLCRRDITFCGRCSAGEPEATMCSGSAARESFARRIGQLGAERSYAMPEVLWPVIERSWHL